MKQLEIRRIGNDWRSRTKEEQDRFMVNLLDFLRTSAEAHYPVVKDFRFLVTDRDEILTDREKEVLKSMWTMYAPHHKIDGIGKEAEVALKKLGVRFI